MVVLFLAAIDIPNLFLEHQTMIQFVKLRRTSNGFQNGFRVEGGVNGLPFLYIGEQPALGVENHRNVAGGAVDPHIEVGIFLQDLITVSRHLFHRVILAGLDSSHPGRRIRHQIEEDVVDQGFLLARQTAGRTGRRFVACVFLHMDELVLLPFDEFERPGADIFFDVAVARLVDDFLRHDDRALRRVCQRRQ